MAELAISSVKPTANSSSRLKKVQVGEAVAEGDFGYKNGSKYYLCDNSTAAAAACTVMFAKAAALDGYTYIIESGDYVDIGVSTTAGELYCIASTAGQSEPHTDVASSEFVTQVFGGTGTAVVQFKPIPTGYAKP